MRANPKEGSRRNRAGDNGQCIPAYWLLPTSFRHAPHLLARDPKITACSISSLKFRHKIRISSPDTRDRRVTVLPPPPSGVGRTSVIPVIRSSNPAMWRGHLLPENVIASLTVQHGPPHGPARLSHQQNFFIALEEGDHLARPRSFICRSACGRSLVQAVRRTTLCIAGIHSRILTNDGFLDHAVKPLGVLHSRKWFGSSCRSMAVIERGRVRCHQPGPGI